MATYDAGRTARLHAVIAAHPDLNAQALAVFFEKNVKTVYMWLKGSPGSIPSIELRLLEMVYPPSRESKPKLSPEDRALIDGTDLPSGLSDDDLALLG